MAIETVEANAGSGGATFAVDNVAGTVFPVSKIIIGADGSEGTLLSGNSGTADAGTLRVSVATDDTVTVDNGGTFAVQVDGGPAVTALQLIDDAVYTDATGTPSKGIAVMGSDGTNPQLINVDSNGNVQVDLVTAAVTNAGTFAVQEDGDALNALQLIDDIVHSGDAAVSKYAAIGAVFDDTTPGTVTENQAQTLRMSAERYLYTEIRDAAGNERGMNVDASGNITVNVNGVVSVDDNSSTLSIDDGGGNISVDWAGTSPPIGAGTEAAALRVTLATDSTGVVSVDDNGGALSVDFGGTVPSFGGGAESGAVLVTVANDSTGVLSVDDNGGTLSVDLAPQTSGGLSFFKTIDLGESEEQVKGSAGQIFGIIAMNLASSVRYLKIWDNTAAGIAVGTDAPDITIPIPTQGDTNGAGLVMMIDSGIECSTGITIAATTAVGDLDTGAPGANEVIVTVLYK